MSKVRRVDYYPDEFLSGTMTVLTEGEMGVYWLICTRVYSTGKPIPNDAGAIARMFEGGHHRRIRAIIDSLIRKGKVVECGPNNPLIDPPIEGGYLTVSRCHKELDRAGIRIEKATDNGRKGGRPSKEINDIEKPAGFGVGSHDEKLTINHQPSTINQQQESPCRSPMGDGSPDGDPPSPDLLGDEPEPKPKAKRGSRGERGTRVPDGDLPDEWAAEANRKRQKLEMPGLSRKVLRLRWESFQLYWRGVSGANGVKRDWLATWLNDCINPHTERKFPAEAPITQQEGGTVAERIGITPLSF